MYSVFNLGLAEPRQVESEQSHQEKNFDSSHTFHPIFCHLSFVVCSICTDASIGVREPKEIEEHHVVAVPVSQIILLSIDEYDSAALYRQFRRRKALF